MNDSTLWTTEQAAEFIGFPKSTLERWRRIRILREQIAMINEGSPAGSSIPELQAQIEKVNGPKLSGPPFIRIGSRQVRYRKSEVINWAEDPI